jgi:hypothetical protein
MNDENERTNFRPQENVLQQQQQQQQQQYRSSSHHHYQPYTYVKYRFNVLILSRCFIFLI